MLSRSVSSALIASAVVAAGSASSSATVLTFDLGAVDGQNFSSLYQAYGDRVTEGPGGVFFTPGFPQFTYGTGGGATPNVTVDYRPGLLFGSSQAPSRRFGDLTNVLYRQFGGDNVIEIDLQPDPNVAVCLYSFDLAAVLSENLPAQYVLVTDSLGNKLFRDAPNSGGPLPIIPAVDGGGNPTRRTYDFTTLLGAPIQPAAGRGIQILIGVGQIPTKVDRIGIDNIKFGQHIVPTPGAAALVIGAGLLAVGRRRR